MSYDYNEAEAAALDLLGEPDVNEVYFGLVNAMWSPDDEQIVFVDTDSGNTVGRCDPDSVDVVAENLKEYDEEIRNDL